MHVFNPSLQERQARHASVAMIASLALLLAACTTPTPPPPGPPPPDSGLFLSQAGDSQGLFVIDTSTGKATRVGSGQTGTTSSSPGLSPSAVAGQLFGSNDTELRLIRQDGYGWTPVGGHAALTEGLAYDADDAVLYAASNGYLYVRSPATGETLATWLRAPNQPDIEGLAFDNEDRVLYGLARGYAVQPEFRQELYKLDVDAAPPAWTAVGSTGGLWESAGLAYDPVERVLYAVGRQGDLGGLFQIDPASGATTKVGATGLAVAAGGLAWR